MNKHECNECHGTGKRYDLGPNQKCENCCGRGWFNI
jgi:hypothetical protein